MVEFFRAKDDKLAIGLTEAQVIALVALALGIGIMYAKRAPRESVATA